MISLEEYIQAVEDVLNRNIKSNKSQLEAISLDFSSDELIVAGPGSGKTTVLILKLLKFYFVDGISLDNIIVTTFTRKAARNLREKTLQWAQMISSKLELGVASSDDFSKLTIDTLDSIAEIYVCADTNIEVIDNFTSSAILMQTILSDDRNNDKKLKSFLKKLKNNIGGVNTSDLNNQVLAIRERMYCDMVDYEKIKADATTEKILYNIIDDYNQQLHERNILDFQLLETHFYEGLLEDKYEKLDNLKILLVDEYQDTNYLQEKIYFELARRIKKNNGSITVVGDDDQSLYRFRGALVDLFTHYSDRINRQLSIEPTVTYLKTNYRSTREIIDFINDFINIDEVYNKTRSVNKPQVEFFRDYSGIPVFGMFRKDVAELSRDLTQLVYEFRTTGMATVHHEDENIIIDTKKRTPSIALLLNSPKEISAYNNKRIPYYIRDSMADKCENISIFNPRGQIIESTDVVSLLCGLILMIVDPDNTEEKTFENLPPHTKNTLKTWREYSQQYVDENHMKLIHVDEHIDIEEVLDSIHDDCQHLIENSSENQVYYDIIVDTILQTNNAINYDGLLTTKQIFWHILIPIASGAIDIDDDLFDISIEENVNIMSIHQSKGLEFDVVIVDVGSDITNNSKHTAFKRFPVNGGKTYNIEKYLRNYTDLDLKLNDRVGLDEAFNDLIRRYYVAYTRAKTVLILVGLNSMKDGYRGDFQNNLEIPNIATGWDRNRKWHWQNLENLKQL